MLMMLGEICITKNHTEALLGGSKEDGLEVCAQKTTYVFVSRHQTTEQNHCIKVASCNCSFENVA
jgi:hypothetical protein